MTGWPPNRLQEVFDIVDRQPASSVESVGQMRPSPGGMRALHPDGYVVYRRRGAHSPYWLHSEGSYEAGFHTLNELAAELRARGARLLYSLPLGVEAATGYVDLSSDEASALFTLIRDSDPTGLD